ncbi:MAG TPA: YeeE/YedE family protein [Burkholderiales bacterium]|nr:YeeE/YedE family protein [Burkholderiales bacterium]
MSIDFAHFTPWASLAGGVLIGTAAAMLVLLNGRIAGISGILGALFVPRSGEVLWRVAFLAGLLVAPALWHLAGGTVLARIEAGYGTLVVAGLLVGLGTSYGSGCTSGHGVCGLSRLSPRSLVATAAFMLSGFATVYVARHLLA